MTNQEQEVMKHLINLWSQIIETREEKDITEFNNTLRKYPNIGLDHLKIRFDEWQEITQYNFHNDIVHGA